MNDNVTELLTENEGWTPQNDAQADWCIGKIIEAENTKKFWRDYYAEQLRKVTAAEDNTIERMNALLASYFDGVPHKKASKSESYALPHGKLVFKQQAPEYTRNDDELIEWLRMNGHADDIKLTESVNWANVKKRICVNAGEAVDAETGEIIAGVKVFERAPIFTVEGVKE